MTQADWQARSLAGIAAGLRAEAPQSGPFGGRTAGDSAATSRSGENGVTLGRVVAVDGAHATIAARTSVAAADADNPLSIGKLISIKTGRSLVIGLIYSVASAEPKAQATETDTTLVQVELVGEIRENARTLEVSFSRGIQSYPPIGAPMASAGASELKIIYDYGAAQTITIGQLSQDARIEATVRVDDLLQKHFAVLGTTGCGKSSAVALLMRQIMQVGDTRILLIDPHNEYKSAFADLAEVVSPRHLDLPFWLFNFEEITDVIYRRRPGVDEEIDTLAELIPLAKAKFSLKSERASTLLRQTTLDDSGHTVDSPVPYRMTDVIAMIDDQLGKLDGKDDRPKLRRLKARIQSVAQDTRYQFMFSNRNIEDTMTEVVRTLFRIPARGRPMTIVEMAGFPAEVVDSVVSVLCRMAFEFGMWSGGRVPLVVVCEEAHRYVPADKRLGFGPTRRAISRIAKEGRKYGVHLGIITQRPAELDPTILSQCSTVFAMRMANDADHAIIRSAVSDAAESTLESLPSMGNREALAFGEAISMPMRVRFTSLPSHELPSSSSPDLQEQVAADQASGFVDDIVRRWRSVAHRG